MNGNIITRHAGFPNSPSVAISPRNPYPLDLGQSVTIHWSSGCADTVSFDQAIGEVALNGSMIVTPQSLPQTYTVTATHEGGSVSRSVTLYQRKPDVSLSPYYSYPMDLGNSVTLTWSTRYADTITMNQGVGDIDPAGSLTVTPESLPVTYTVTGTNEAGATSRSVTLYQIAPRGTITAFPTQLKVGDSTTLTWTSTRADTCTITPDIGEVDCNGTMEVIPTRPTRYYLDLSGPGGTYRPSVYVGFVAPMADLKTSTTSIIAGESVELSWIFANATSCVIDHGIGEVELGGVRTIMPPVTTTFTMTATGPGGTATDRVTINVVPENPPTFINFTSNDVIIIRGGSALLNWESYYADSVSIAPDVGAVSLNGTTTVTPEATTTYTATAVNGNGTATDTVTITVVQPAPTINLGADPETIMFGGSATLTWDSLNADSLSFNQGIGSVELQGSLTVSPLETTTYIATATGPGGDTTKGVTINVTYPEPTVSFSAVPLSVKYGEPITLEWYITNAENVTIDQGVGVVDFTGTLTVYPEEDTVYTITVTDPGGIVTAQATVTVIPGPITLTITSPTEGDTLSRPDVMVTGTVIHADGLETGVVVNGVVALVYGGQFVANHVPLVVGENTISVRAIDVNGEHGEEFITVTVEQANRYVELNTGTESSLAPLEISLTLVNNFTMSAQPEMSYTGPAEAQFLDISEVDTWIFSITAPGIYVFTAEVQDANGATYSDRVAVLAYDRNILDALLQSKWDGMKTAMIAGNIDGAVHEFTYGQRQVFQEIFTIAQDRLPQIALDMQGIELIHQKNDTAEYRINRDVIYKGSPETITFYIYFQREADGIWRIRDF